MRAGTLAFFRVKVYDNTQFPRRLLSPASGVTLTIYKPDGTALISDAPMTTVAEGIFTYKHQTQATDPLGYYTCSIRAVDQNAVGTSRFGAFTLDSV